jgi:hypothetical protein
LDQTTANTFTVAPVRNDVANTGNVLFYNTTSKEITYGNTISVAGNVTGAYIKGNGSELTSLPAPVVTQDITSNGAMSIMTYDGVIKYVNYATVEPSSGNIAGGNITTAGLVSATGNVTGNYFIGNGSQLTGISSGIQSSIANGTSNVNIATANGNTTITANAASTWTFGTDSTLTLPAGSSRITSYGQITIETDNNASGMYLNADGVNLLYANANVTLRANSTGTNKDWNFGNTGVLTLPNADATGFGNIYFEENSSTITFGLDDNATPYLYSFSTSGITLPKGGIVSEGAAPTGLGNTIAITPSGGSDVNQQLLVYPTGNIVEGNHLHLTTGDLYNTELFLGNDNLYVKLANTGNVVVNTDDTIGNTAQWTFGTDGNLTLPGNIIAINYANGNRVTGGVTFDGEAVIGTGTSNTQSGLYLAPDPVSLTNDLYLRVRGNILDEPTHIHFDTGNNQYYNQFIGDDNKYIQLANTGNIVINTSDYAGNTAQWTFDTTGNLTLPGGSRLNPSGANLAIFAGGGYVNLITADESSRMGVSGAGGFITTAGGNWQFDTTGNLTVPGGGAVFSIGNGTIGVTANATSGNAYLGLADTGSAATLYGNASVQLVTNGNVGWNFQPSGNLTFPNGAVFTGYDLYAAANSYVELAGYTGNTYMGVGNDGVFIQTDWNGAQNQWSFFANATMTAPGAISAVGNVTGGNIVTSGSGGDITLTGGNITGANVVTANVVSATGNVQIISSGNIWTFGTTGNLNAPGNISAVGNITSGNITTAGQVSATGNITTANSFVGNLVGTTVSVTGNVTAGNVIINGQTVELTGAVNGAYLLAQNTTDQSVGLNGVVNFQTTNASNGSIINKISNSQVTLAAGNTYKLEAIVRRLTSSSTWGAFRWYDVTNAAYVGIEGFSEVVTGSSAIGSTNVATAYVTPSVNTTYELRQTTVNTISVSANYATIEITQVNPTVSLSAVSTISASGNVSVGGNLAITGNITGNVATTFESTWTVPTGNSTQNFTVTPGNTYLMWVDCNIPNGILVWNATGTVTNTNVPVVGTQYAWVYNGGGTPIDFTSIPNQFIGTANAIVRSNVAPSSTTNRFDFGINNTSGGNVTVRYGYTKIS